MREALRSLVAWDCVEVEGSEAVEDALAWSAAGLDFAGALHLVSMGAAQRFASLDERFAKRAQRIGGVQVERL